MKKITKQLTLSLKNPFIYHHVVYGQNVLPGLAYIDIIYQIFREHGFSCSELQLRNLSIYQPLTAEQDAVIVLNIQCEEKKKDSGKSQPRELKNVMRKKLQKKSSI